MPAQPQVSSSATRAGRRPVSSAYVCWMKSTEYSPTLAAFLTISQGNSSDSSYWCATGRISRSEKSWTQSRISFCSSVSSKESISAPGYGLAENSTRTYRSTKPTPIEEPESSHYTEPAADRTHDHRGRSPALGEPAEDAEVERSGMDLGGEVRVGEDGNREAFQGGIGPDRFEGLHPGWPGQHDVEHAQVEVGGANQPQPGRPIAGNGQLEAGASEAERVH